MNHNCECAACNTRRLQEQKALEEGGRKIQELIDKGQFDYLKTKETKGRIAK